MLAPALSAGRRIDRFVFPIRWARLRFEDKMTWEYPVGFMPLVYTWGYPLFGVHSDRAAWEDPAA